MQRFLFSCLIRLATKLFPEQQWFPRHLQCCQFRQDSNSFFFFSVRKLFLQSETIFHFLRLSILFQLTLNLFFSLSVFLFSLKFSFEFANRIVNPTIALARR